MYHHILIDHIDYIDLTMSIIIISKAMFSISRGLCHKNIQQSTATHFVVRSIRNHHTWKSKKVFIQDKIDCRKLPYLKLQKCDFRTTQSLCIPPIMALIMRPVLRIGALLMGRGLKAWWKRKPEKEREKYKQWFKERMHVFLGKPCFKIAYLIIFFTLYFIFLYILFFHIFFTPYFTFLHIFQGCFGLYGLVLFIYYVTHLETDPLTKRSRFIIFNKEQEEELAKMVLETVSKSIKYIFFFNLKHFAIALCIKFILYCIILL